MVASRRLSLALLPALALVAAGCGLQKTKSLVITQTATVTTTVPASTTTARTGPCAATDLTGVFGAIPGSAGAGQISYGLTVTNSSQAACTVTGLPTLQLLGANGNELPTHQDAAHPGQATSALITLQPGQTATAQARFSPDVNGAGDSQSGACQPKATAVRATIGWATLTAPVQPPTSVCEQGALHVDVFTASS